MKVFKRMTAILASAMIMTSSVIAASADDKLTREQIIDAFWGSAWGNLSDGTDYPQGSLEYHILESWLDDYYLANEMDIGEEDTTTLNENYIPFNWADEHSVEKAFRKYLEDYTKYWHFADENGTFYIESYDPITDTYGNDVLYHFELDGDTWLMLDEDEKIVDSFAVHGGDGSWSEWNVGEEEDNEEEAADLEVYEDKDNNAAEEAAEAEGTETHRVTGTTAAAHETNEEATAHEEQRDESEESSQSKMPIIIGGAALIAVGAVFMTSKKGKK